MTGEKMSGASLINIVKKIVWDTYVFILIKNSPRRNRKLVRKIKNKETVKVAFLMQLASSWKYDNLFRLLSDSKRFEPVVVLTPIRGHDDVSKYRELEMALDFYTGQGYPVFNTWDSQSETWRDIKKELAPDIVFFSNPWEELSEKAYYIFNFLDTLTCYAPYGFKSSHLYQAIFNKPFQNLLWRIFYETKMHKELAFKFARNKGVNGFVTGYPGMDNLLDETYIPEDAWKIKDRTQKRIIWSPHHSIFGRNDSNVGFSTFLKYWNFMLELANEYKDRIQISFKPHPLLRPKLYKHTDWGKEKTDHYFEKWANMNNTQLNEGNYIDLFLTSDAIINDGESFLVEYLYTKKPAMFLVADSNVSDRFNEFGKLSFEHLYHGHNEDDIITFVNNVIAGKDEKGSDRNKYFDEMVRPPHNQLASENIFKILNEVFN